MKGQCLCGSIEVIAPDTTGIDVCHCSTCRRWSGGPMLAVHVGSEVTFAGDDPGVFHSSDWAERGFCRSCGTHLFYHLKDNGEYILPAGLFSEGEFSMNSEIFIDEKPDYYTFSNDTQKMTGAEVFAMFAGESADNS